MKNLILTVFLFFIANFFSAQEQQEVNAFQKSENAATGTVSGGAAMQRAEADGSTGNPPGDSDDSIPIDDYMPVLAIIGGFIIIYKFRHKIKVL